MEQTAKLIGGPKDGQTEIFEGKSLSIQFDELGKESDGRMRIVRSCIYKLKSTEPFIYEFSQCNSN